MEATLPHTGGELAAAYRRVRDEVYEKRARLVKPRAEQPTVAEFYKGKSVFMTGGSGFLGRLLVEQLLRTCPGIGNIYLLLRARKGQQPQDRLKGLVDVPMFDRLRAEQPDALSKVVVLPGDITEPGLGLSQEHWLLLQREVSVVFHVAASVRFDDPFQKAVFTNLRSTRDVVELARGMPLLKALVHVSTAYTNTNRSPMEELVYEPHLDWEEVIRMAETMDAASLWAMDCLGPKLRDFQPNSYTFTKALAEKLIDDVAFELPVVIVRPSIVMPTFKDPIPGWIDNLYGLGAFWAGGWKGLIRVTYSSDHAFDSVPADVVTKTTVLASWARGRGIRIRPVPDDAVPKKGVEVVHATIGNEIGVSYRDMQWAVTDLGVADRLAYPGMIRDPKYTLITNKMVYLILHWYHHLLYGAVLDTLARLTGRKPRAIKLYRALEASLQTVNKFDNDFTFEVVNQRLLQILMHPADEEAYCAMDVYGGRDNLDVLKKWYFDICKGVLVYALKEEHNPEKYTKQIKRLRLLMKVYHGTMIAVAGFVLYCVVPV